MLQAQLLHYGDDPNYLLQTRILGNLHLNHEHLIYFELIFGDTKRAVHVNETQPSEIHKKVNNGQKQQYALYPTFSYLSNSWSVKKG